MSGVSWEQMVDEVVVRGRPSEVESAAVEWAGLLGVADGVVQALRGAVGDLAARGVWSGPAAEAFGAHVAGIADGLASVVASARSGNGLGVEGALRKAAGDLSEAQGRMPVPLASMGEVLAARNGHVSIGPGSFAVRLSGAQVAGLVGSSPVAAVIDAFVRDKTGEARAVYDRVGDKYGDTSSQAPSGEQLNPTYHSKRMRPDLRSGPVATGRGASVARGMTGSVSPEGNVAGPRSAGPLPDRGTGDVVVGSGPTDGLRPSGGGLAQIDPHGGGDAPMAGRRTAESTLGSGFGGSEHLGNTSLSPAGAGTSRAMGRGRLGNNVSPIGMTRGGPRGGGSLGKPVSPAGGAAPMGSGAGMVAPTGSQGGPNRRDPDRSTWLVEDEDVWGLETDAPPSVLRGDD